MAESRSVERSGYAVAALLVLSGLIHLAILLMMGASWEGPLSFRKPMTFGLSFGVTLATIIWVAGYVMLNDRLRARLLAGFTVACAVETALITVQAWRGVPSHFNMETRTDALIAQVLALGGAALVVVIFTLTVAAFRRNPLVPPSMRIAVRAGFLALCAAQIAGAAMIGRGVSLVVRGHAQAAYATGGFLKPTHAVTMHAILVLPAAAWLLSRLPWSEEQRVRVVSMAVAGYVLVAGVVVVRNLTNFNL